MKKINKYIFKFLIFLAFLGFLYFISKNMASLDTFDSLVRRLAFSLGNQALSRLLLKGGCSVGLTAAIAILLDFTGDRPSVGNNMMDQAGSSGGSEACVNQQAQNPEPDLSHPLLDDNARHAELNERAGFHFVGLEEDKQDKVLKAQVIIERAIEKALLSDGYSRDELSQRNKRDEIRAFLFYPKGKLLSFKKYESYVKEVEFGTHRSQPYEDLIKAISSSHLFLRKVHKIKRWERWQLW